MNFKFVICAFWLLHKMVGDTECCYGLFVLDTMQDLTKPMLNGHKDLSPILTCFIGRVIKN